MASAQKNWVYTKKSKMLNNLCKMNKKGNVATYISGYTVETFGLIRNKAVHLN